MSSRTYTRNAFESSLDGGITAGATSIALDSATGLTAPCWLCIDPDNPAKREYVKVGSISTDTLLGVTRGGDGSAGGPQDHDTGAVVRAVPVHQTLDDLFTDIETLEAGQAAHVGGTDTADHPEVTTSTRGFMSATDKVKLDQFLTATNYLKTKLGGGGASEVPEHSHASAAQGGAVTGIVPAGGIVAYAGAAAPTGWQLCDGSALNRTTFSALFAAIGETYGPGDGSTTFNVPDLQQRFPLGKASSGTGATLGDDGGSIDHEHTQPTHTHTGPSHTHTGPSHTHTGPSHTHSTPNHTHTDTFAVGAETAGDGSGPSPGTAGSGHFHALNGSVSSSGSGTTGAGGTGATGADGTGATSSAGTGNTGSGGGDATGTENPPFLVVNYIIKT